MNRRIALRSALALPLGIGLGWCATGCSSVPLRYQGAAPPRALDSSVASEHRLALVLGSGGPRGFAHVGVLRALEAQGIKPDLVVGTSMGALVGALWASGQSARQIQQLLWNAQPMQWWRDLQWHRFGWLSGESLQRELNAQVGHKRIEQFPIRFVAVATRLPTGERTEFASGDAGAAVRASSSIVGLFVPVQIGEHAYGDGDLVAPVPVATARRLGARSILAVDVSADLRDTPSWERSRPEWVSNGIMRRQLIEAEMALADVPIYVRMSYFTGASADYKNYAADMAEQVTLKALQAARLAPA